MSTKNIDPRLVPMVRTLKENPNTFKNSMPKQKSKLHPDEEVQKNNNIQESLQENPYYYQRSKNTKKTLTKTLKNSHISIDGGLEQSQPQKYQSSTSNNYHLINANNKIRNNSKKKELEPISQNKMLSTQAINMDQINAKIKSYNNIKTRKKYVMNLLNNMSIKKYIKSCIQLLKNDNELKNLYDQGGFDKSNNGYENFLDKFFFNRDLFMYKLEMLFLDESNFIKKNFKENFFKKEMKYFLNNSINDSIYHNQVNTLNGAFTDTFQEIENFNLFHD